MTARRISFVSPLPPEPTGVADYSRGLLPGLAAQYPICVYTRRPDSSRPLLAGSLPIRSYGELDSGTRGCGTIYQIGNHHGFHGSIYELALRRPGVSVLHEYVLHDLVRESALAAGGQRAYAAELRYALGRTGDALSRRVEVGGEGLSRFTWPLFERIVDRSLCSIVHSETARRRLLASRPRAAVVVAPHHVTEHPPDTSEVVAFRHRHGLDDGTFLAAAFGVVAPTKQLDLALAAFEAIDSERPRAFLVVGEGGRSWLRARRLEQREGVRHLALGRVDDDELRCAMASTDVALNLRDPTGGETSGTCLRLLALGRTVVVSDQGWFSEIPDDCCAKVPVDGVQRSTLTALLRGLEANDDLRRRIGHNARRWTRSHHDLAATVRAYGRALELAAERDAEDLARHPPLAPFSHDDVLSELVQEIAAATGDLGITEEDDSVLAELAKTVAALDLHRDAPRD